MSSKQSIINKELEKAIKDALKATSLQDTDIKDRVSVINAAIKWEAVKAKMADDSFGSHFNDDEREDDEQGNGDTVN